MRWDLLRMTLKKPSILLDRYKNDNSFKAYINILAVITSHFTNLKNAYQIYSQLGKKTNLALQEHRGEIRWKKEMETRL